MSRTETPRGILELPPFRTYIDPLNTPLPETGFSDENKHEEEPMTIDERLVDAKLEVVEAHTDTKFAQLLGKMDVIAERVGSLNTQIGALDTKLTTVDGHARSAKATIIATVIGTGLAVAALAWGGVQIFQGGMDTSSAAFQAGITASEKKNDNAQRSSGAGQAQQVPQGAPGRPKG